MERNGQNVILASARMIRERRMYISCILTTHHVTASTILFTRSYLVTACSKQEDKGLVSLQYSEYKLLLLPIRIS